MNKKEKAAQENRAPKQHDIMPRKTEEDLLGCQVLSSRRGAFQGTECPGFPGNRKSPDGLFLFVVLYY